MVFLTYLQLVLINYIKLKQQALLTMKEFNECNCRYYIKLLKSPFKPKNVSSNRKIVVIPCWQKMINITYNEGV